MTDLVSSSSAQGLFNNYNSDTSSNKFAFLVHSQDTLPNNLPPHVDDKPLARQKRRRTSPEDQSILEAEYEKNPKPDKAARIRIVSRVALGEKEVQIWFQNRRQNTRRKSRPLLPHEILPSPQQNSSAEPLFSDVCSSQESTVVPVIGKAGSEDNRDARDGEGSSQSDTTSITQPLHNCDPKLKAGVKVKVRDRDGTENVPSLRSDSCFKSQGTTDDDRPIATAPRDIPKTRIPKPSQEHTYPLKTSLGYISNRRNILPGNTSPSDDARSAIPSRQGFHCHVHLQEGSKPAPLLKRKSSLVRLSLSLDGKAEVVMSEEESPSLSQPVIWKAPAPRADGLQRSKSAIDIIERPGRRLSGGTPLPGSAIGRSRDARTWEFYCDSEARSTLSTQESSGSASEAINKLLRCRKNPLQPSISKRNAQLAAQKSSKRLKATTGSSQKQKLVRTTSSLARLQTTDENQMKEPTKPKANKKSSLDIPDIPDNSGDSDKENWIPGTKVAAEQRQPENWSGKPVLGESESISSQTTSFGVTTGREKLRQRHPARPYLTTGPEVDIEEPREDPTHREPQSSSSVSGEEELDCVQNLLSLRKGCWR